MPSNNLLLLLLFCCPVSSEPECNSSTTSSTSSLFSRGLVYLFPFNIEYHIFVSVLLFVMWKNIGRTISSNKKSLVTKTQGLTLGPILGLLTLASTIAVLVVYITRIEGVLEMRQSAVSMFYIYGIVMLAVMCFSCASGLLIYRADHMPLDTSKNTSRQLDTELLFGSSLGSWFLSWCSVVAVLCTDSKVSYRWTNLVYSIFIVLEKYLQNLFIIESLYRKQERVERSDPELPAVSEIFSVTSSMAPPFSGIINRAYETPDKTPEMEQEESREMYRCEEQPEEPLNMKRLILKNIAVFLIMCNISVGVFVFIIKRTYRSFVKNSPESNRSFLSFSCGSSLHLAADHSTTMGWSRTFMASLRGPRFSILLFL